MKILIFVRHWRFQNEFQISFELEDPEVVSILCPNWPSHSNWQAKWNEKMPILVGFQAINLSFHAAVAEWLVSFGHQLAKKMIHQLCVPISSRRFNKVTNPREKVVTLVVNTFSRVIGGSTNPLKYLPSPQSSIYISLPQRIHPSHNALLGIWCFTFQCSIHKAPPPSGKN